MRVTEENENRTNIVSVFKVLSTLGINVKCNLHYVNYIKNNFFYESYKRILNKLYKSTNASKDELTVLYIVFIDQVGLTEC